jgi:hypothetical protein
VFQHVLLISTASISSASEVHHNRVGVSRFGRGSPCTTVAIGNGAYQRMKPALFVKSEYLHFQARHHVACLL